ncbi:hypothetical protein VP01_967g2 [Puccinia sorghi]|uniref:Uncharacterized protein n=1 Tax=Puccinia sorghi TaxID=27349 RepID=A0A0L6U607_9BASI|nr:hypothetical protein VP01_967g2 [Puccinia sorghi]
MNRKHNRLGWENVVFLHLIEHGGNAHKICMIHQMGSWPKESFPSLVSMNTMEKVRGMNFKWSKANCITNWYRVMRIPVLQFYSSGLFEFFFQNNRWMSRLRVDVTKSHQERLVICCLQVTSAIPCALEHHWLGKLIRQPPPLIIQILYHSTQMELNPFHFPNPSKRKIQDLEIGEALSQTSLEFLDMIISNSQKLKMLLPMPCCHFQKYSSYSKSHLQNISYFLICFPFWLIEVMRIPVLQFYSSGLFEFFFKIIDRFLALWYFTCIQSTIEFSCFFISRKFLMILEHHWLGKLGLDSGKISNQYFSKYIDYSFSILLIILKTTELNQHNLNLVKGLTSPLPSVKNESEEKNSTFANINSQKLKMFLPMPCCHCQSEKYHKLFFFLLALSIIICFLFSCKYPSAILIIIGLLGCDTASVMKVWTRTMSLTPQQVILYSFRGDFGRVCSST